eukprot:CAMPEP_0170520578 /NCGR_PEP_ID=MMETSP0209-20121228/5875_1 /TAXON_ID=665100 ORGANISM="Litonotus pictus, Strain P1" /NCGR_SAMPLE_ID=MMETSP0209 /ASSEMBLY_ACC=CAM_ASM_000301 /LENGTH=506 /DNA_ID=CAMNT_0010806961 /DNA_START=68 /DNA_END=1589 /DNA_ORIENTATION=+
MEFQYVQAVAENWSRGPVVSLSFDRGNCTNEKEPIITNEWPGIVDFCYCSGEDWDEPELHVGHCPSDGEGYILSGCDAWNGIKPKNYTKWMDYTICGSRMNLNYLQLKVSEDSVCPSGNKPCGVLDSMGSILCVDLANECPINDIQFLNFNSNSSNTTTNTNTNSTSQTSTIQMEGFTYQQVTIRSETSSRTVRYTNQNIDSNLFIDYEIHEGKPCIDPFFYNNVYGQQLQYEKSTVNGECPVFEVSEDTRKKVSGIESPLNIATRDDIYLLDTDRKDQIYDYNNITLSIKGLPEYKRPPSIHNMNLYASQYYPIASHCRARLEEHYSNEEGESDRTKNHTDFIDHLLSLKEEYDDIDHFFSAARIVAMITMIIYCIIYCVVMGFCCAECNMEGKQYSPMIVTFILFSLMVLIPIAVAVGKFSQLGKDYYILLDHFCLDLPSHYMFDELRKASDQAEGLFLGALIIGIIEFAVFPFIFLFCGTISNTHPCADKNKGNSGEVEEKKE